MLRDSATLFLRTWQPPTNPRWSIVFAAGTGFVRVKRTVYGPPGKRAMIAIELIGWLTDFDAGSIFVAYWRSKARRARQGRALPQKERWK
jgi:hypothetical protein